MGMTGMEDMVRMKKKMAGDRQQQIKIQAPGSEAQYQSHRHFPW